MDVACYICLRISMTNKSNILIFDENNIVSNTGYKVATEPSMSYTGHQRVVLWPLFGACWEISDICEFFFFLGKISYRSWVLSEVYFSNISVNNWNLYEMKIHWLFWKYRKYSQDLVNCLKIRQCHRYWSVFRYYEVTMFDIFDYKYSSKKNKHNYPKIAVCDSYVDAVLLKSYGVSASLIVDKETWDS